MVGLEKILLEPRSQIRGVVLDGFPQNKEQFDALQRRSILPLRVIELNIKDQECHRRNEHEIAVKEAYHAAVEVSALKITESYFSIGIFNTTGKRRKRR